MKTVWTPETMAQTTARIEYKTRVAEHFGRVAYYFKNYYIRNPRKNLDSLIIEYINLINIGITKDYKNFLSLHNRDFYESLVCLMNKGVEIEMNNKLYAEAFDTLMKLNKYIKN